MVLLGQEGWGGTRGWMGVSGDRRWLDSKPEEDLLMEDVRRSRPASDKCSLMYIMQVI